MLVMTRREVGKLLITIQHFIPTYVPTKDMADSWHKALGDMTYEEAEKHLYAHFKESEYLPKPYDILKRVNPNKLKTIKATDEEAARLREYYNKQRERNLQRYSAT